MRLEQVIKRLEQEDPNRVCSRGFLNPHSYRGDYSELAFSPATDVTVGEMLAAARSAIGATYQGYKGGDYRMDEFTPCYIAGVGKYGGDSDAIENHLEGMLLDSRKWSFHAAEDRAPEVVGLNNGVTVRLFGETLDVSGSGRIPLAVIDRLKMMQREAEF